MSPRLEPAAPGEVRFLSSSSKSKSSHEAKIISPRRGAAWRVHLRRLYWLNYCAVAVFAVSMYSFLASWDGALNRQSSFKLALCGVLASMTYLFGFFGISFVSGVVDGGCDSASSSVVGSPTSCKRATPPPSPPSAPAFGPYRKAAPSSSSAYTLEQPEVVIVGMGTAGTSLGIALARQGRKVAIVEKSFEYQDRIVGELMQPGGIRALESLGLLRCATEGCDSVRVDGYTVILPPGVSQKRPQGAETVLFYPDSDPEGLLKHFGAGVDAAHAGTPGTSAAPRGRSFHNWNFVQRLREVARTEPNVRVIEGTVTQLLEEDGKVVGVRYKAAVAAEQEGVAAGSIGRSVLELRAPLTVVADGIWSGLRRCANVNKPVLISSFVGVVARHPPMESPVPHRHCGHVVLAQPSPILIYQISPTETRVLVDVVGPMPSSATGELAKFLQQQARWLPEGFRAAYLEGVASGNIRSMPNRALPTSTAVKPGAVLIGDALNMRHPLTGGGMTVALKDVVLLAELLGGKDCADAAAVAAAVKTFHRRRQSHAATINVLANALYSVFTTPTGEGDNGDPEGAYLARCHLQDACFDYLSLGGAYSAGPIGLLSGLTPSPSMLATHFFMVALHGCQKHLLPLGFLSPWHVRHVYRLLSVACGIIMPLLEIERSTMLSWLPVRKVVQLLFPWEHLRWEC